MQGAPALSDLYNEKSVSLSSKQVTTTDIISTLLFIGFSAIAIYYGWNLGRQYGPSFWIIIQAIGSTIRSYIIQLISYAQEYARRSR
jgi:hypothetical protein